MNLLLYANGRNSAGERLRNVIEALVPKRKTEICTTIDSLSRRLRKPMYNVAVAVLLAATRKELWEIHSMRDLLRDIRIILILPDRACSTVFMGHKLYPRFISYADGDFMDVAAILGKMLGNKYPSKYVNTDQQKHQPVVPFDGKLHYEKVGRHLYAAKKDRTPGLLRQKLEL